jgi:hypothetical protein
MRHANIPLHTGAKPLKLNFTCDVNKRAREEEVSKEIFIGGAARLRRVNPMGSGR